jgi:hypothetical protein
VTPSTACGLGNTSPMRRNRIGAQLPTVRKLDEEIADTGKATAEKRALRTRKEALEMEHTAKSSEELADEDTGRLEDWKGENRVNTKKRVKLDEDKKKLFFTIWANMSEVSIQKVKEHLTVPVWLELELNSQDSLERHQSDSHHCETRQ